MKRRRRKRQGRRQQRRRPTSTRASGAAGASPARASRSGGRRAAMTLRQSAGTGAGAARAGRAGDGLQCLNAVGEETAARMPSSYTSLPTLVSKRSQMQRMHALGATTATSMTIFLTDS